MVTDKPHTKAQIMDSIGFRCTNAVCMYVCMYVCNLQYVCMYLCDTFLSFKKTLSLYVYVMYVCDLCSCFKLSG